MIEKLKKKAEASKVEEAKKAAAKKAKSKDKKKDSPVEDSSESEDSSVEDSSESEDSSEAKSKRKKSKKDKKESSVEDSSDSSSEDSYESVANKVEMEKVATIETNKPTTFIGVFEKYLTGEIGKISLDDHDLPIIHEHYAQTANKLLAQATFMNDVTAVQVLNIGSPARSRMPVVTFIHLRQKPSVSFDKDTIKVNNVIVTSSPTDGTPLRTSIWWRNELHDFYIQPGDLDDAVEDLHYGYTVQGTVMSKTPLSRVEKDILMKRLGQLDTTDMELKTSACGWRKVLDSKTRKMQKIHRDKDEQKGGSQVDRWSEQVRELFPRYLWNAVEELPALEAPQDPTPTKETWEKV